MTFRKEIKYDLSKINLEILISNLIEDGMITLYPNRRVISYYFDTNDLIFYNESLNGILPRYKYRLRTYDQKKVFYKEIKISSIEGRFKTSQKISEDEFKNLYQNGTNFKSYGLIKPNIEVSYLRQYFLYKDCRLTLDYEISYVNQNSINQIKFFDESNVMELKTSIDQDNSFLDKIFSFKPVSFSKYARGISKTNIFS
tara:strand:+ start:11938 stop:12534 length:597 start_codon:yes stop_codon:yes gene_type:complete